MAGYRGVSRAVLRNTDMAPLSMRRVVLPDDYSSGEKALFLMAWSFRPGSKVVERIPTGEKYSIMFAKDSPLAGQVNEVLTQLKQEGYLAKLHETWFGAAADSATTTVQVAEMPKAK